MIIELKCHRDFKQPQTSQVRRGWQTDAPRRIPHDAFQPPPNANIMHPRLHTVFSPGNDPTKRQNSEKPSAVRRSSTHVSTRIGTITTTEDPKEFAFGCVEPNCSDRSFSRVCEFRRHFQENHTADRTHFWCTVVGCQRSKGRGGESFKRKASMVHHRRRAHGIME